MYSFGMYSFRMDDWQQPYPLKFTTAQLLELSQVFDRAFAESVLPNLPDWYLALTVPERGDALVRSKTLTSRKLNSN